MDRGLAGYSPLGSQSWTALKQLSMHTLCGGILFGAGACFLSTIHRCDVGPFIANGKVIERHCMCLRPDYRNYGILKASGIARGKHPASLLVLTSSLAELCGVLWCMVPIFQNSRIDLQAGASFPISPVMVFNS